MFISAGTYELFGQFPRKFFIIIINEFAVCGQEVNRKEWSIYSSGIAPKRNGILPDSYRHIVLTWPTRVPPFINWDYRRIRITYT